MNYKPCRAGADVRAIHVKMYTGKGANNHGTKPMGWSEGGGKVHSISPLWQTARPPPLPRPLFVLQSLLYLALSLSLLPSLSPPFTHKGSGSNNYGTKPMGWSKGGSGSKVQ